MVKLLLIERMFPYPQTKSAKLHLCRITQVAQVGRIYLRMTIELPEIFIDQRRIQEGSETTRQIIVETMTILMEIVQVVFEANKVGHKVLRLVNGCDNTSCLLF